MKLAEKINRLAPSERIMYGTVIGLCMMTLLNITFNPPRVVETIGYKYLCYVNNSAFGDAEYNEITIDNETYRLKICNPNETRTR